MRELLGADVLLACCSPALLRCCNRSDCGIRFLLMSPPCTADPNAVKGL